MMSSRETLTEAADDVVDETLLRVLRLQPIEIPRLLEIVDLARHLRVAGRLRLCQPFVVLLVGLHGPSNEFGS